MALDDLVVTVERICVVLRTMANQLEAERGSDDPKVVLLRSIVRSAEVELARLGQAPFDETPVPGATYVERLLVALEDPRGSATPLALRWLRRWARQSVILVTEMAKALEVFGDLELVDGAKRWLERTIEGPDDQASSE